MFHHREDRIRAHIQLCWLALLLIRIIENATGDTWHNIRRHLHRLHAGTFTGPTGLFRQRTELSNPQRDLQRKYQLLETRLGRVSQHVSPGQALDHGL